MELRERVFLVSGGGSGLGAAAATRLVAGGARVVIADLDAPSGEAVAARLGPGAIFHHTDVTADVTADAAAAGGSTPGAGSIEGAIDLALRHFGRLDGAVGCAGIALAERVVGREGAHPLEHFRRVIEVNLVGMFNLIRMTAATLAKRQPDASGTRGVIVATASIAAYDGQIGQAAYAASKGGIVAMTLPIARDLARHGIRMMTIAPGLFDTPLLAGLPPEVRQELGGQAPFPARLGHPDEYAALVAHIIENEMLNGEVIRLDGALRMPPR